MREASNGRTATDTDSYAFSFHQADRREEDRGYNWKTLPSVYKISLLLILAAFITGQAQTTDARSRDSIVIHFPQSKWNLDPALAGNAVSLDSIHRKLTDLQGDSIYQIRHVSVIGGASPEGTVRINKYLSEKRAYTLFDLFRKYSKLEDADTSFTFLGRDWEGVLAYVLIDRNVPYRDETISLLERIVTEKKLTGREPANSLYNLKRLRGGKPYLYLYNNIFPSVRASKVIIDYDRHAAIPDSLPVIDPTHAEPVEVADTLPEYVELDISEVVRNHIDSVMSSEKPFYIDLRSNLLYDALLLPNIGAEFYMGKNFSAGINWMYGWWSKDIKHIYWRAYGGEIFSRLWFGRKAHEKPLTGLHLGIYGQYYLYDFELGGKGEMAGNPEETLWKQGLYGGGIEFGYSLPVKRRLNIDFSLGIGYSGGTYHKYIPVDTHYVWQGTYHRNYIGPTKLEIALVWLIGRGNFNRKGGGR